jgi:hypothetical protein
MEPTGTEADEEICFVGIPEDPPASVVANEVHAKTRSYYHGGNENRNNGKGAASFAAEVTMLKQVFLFPRGAHRGYLR